MRHFVPFDDPRYPPWFWARTIPEPNSGCWLWIGGINGDRYGTYGRPTSKRTGLTQLMHRFSMSMCEPLVNGLTIDHRCETRCCVNPHHLEQVTNEENLHRIQIRNFAAIATCPNGHPWDDKNTYLNTRPILTRSGRPKVLRKCRACHNARMRAVTKRRASGGAS